MSEAVEHFYIPESIVIYVQIYMYAPLSSGPCLILNVSHELFA